MPSVLIVDDESNIRRMVRALLVAEGYAVRDAADGEAALASALDAEPDVALVDLLMPGALDGMALLERLRARLPDVSIVMMSGRAGLGDAVRATRLGAVNFLEKPLTPDGVLMALASAVELRQARREAATLRADLGLTNEMVGESAAIRRVRDVVARVAPTDARVLVHGESGTGKELVAAAIHRASERRDRPFVRVNCAAIPRDLVESEMFGHERGAFTGATERRVGRFELAHRGTLLLDEVGDLSGEAQAKLLRAVESGEIERLGGGDAIRVDVRTVAATHRDLARLAAAGQFREDLLFRLNVIPVTVPPLRARLEDLPLLVRHFTVLFRARTGRPPPVWREDALAALARHRWPGNVRELANLVERMAILHGGAEVRAADVRTLLAPGVEAVGTADEDGRPATSAAEAEGGSPSLHESLDAYERTLIVRALAAVDGNVAAAARRLRTDRPNLYRRMRRLGIVDHSEPPAAEARGDV